MRNWIRVGTLGLLGTLLCSCSDVQPVGPTQLMDRGAVASPSARRISIPASLGGSSTNPRFAFLPPLGFGFATLLRPFDRTLAPEVRICAWSGTSCAAPDVAVFSTPASRQREKCDDHSQPVVCVDAIAYQTEWRLKDYAVAGGQTYRIRVIVAGNELGHADVQVRGAGQSDTGEQNALPIDRHSTLPIFFRIDKGAVSVLGTSGGTATSTDGKVSLVIPPGALPSDVGVSIVPSSVPTGFLGGYDFQPSGLTFNVPVTATINVDPSRVPANTEPWQVLYVWNAAGTNWQTIPRRYDAGTHVLTATMTHFSSYGMYMWSSDGVDCGRVLVNFSGVILGCPTLLNPPQLWDTVTVAPNAQQQTGYLVAVNILTQSYGISGIVPACVTPATYGPDWCIGEVTARSDDPSIATIDSGLVTGKKLGQTLVREYFGSREIGRSVINVAGTPSCPNGTPNTVLPELRPAVADTMRSVRGDTTLTIRFINNSGQAVSVYWLDYTGTRQLYFSLPAGVTGSQPTYLTHPWVIVGASGTDLGVFLAAKCGTAIEEATINPAP